ncbi:MAG: sensor histidine kinase [Actinomycetota bacterium]
MASGENRRRAAALVSFELAIILPTLGVLAAGAIRNPSVFKWELVGWAGLVAVVVLLPVPAWRGLTISLDFPLLMMVAVLYSPIAAASTALLGSTDPRELKREIGLLQAVFNRCQVAISVLAASSVYHAIAGTYPRGHAGNAFEGTLAVLIASVADYLVNTGMVTVYVSIKTALRPAAVIRELRIGRLGEFLFSYLGLGVFSLALAVLFTRAGLWVLPTVFPPLILARQMFFRSLALEEAHQELQVREQVLRSLSNAMAEERADERQKIAAYLHDDLAQVMFRLSIQVDVARKLLEKGDLAETGAQLEKIRESKQDTSDRIRALIRDLHRSPLGAKGLAEALESFTDEVGRDSGVHFHLDVHDVAMPAPIALLIYHIAREGLMNALKHAQASDFWIIVRGDEEFLELQLRDNGMGFDTTLPGPEGHFGMAMMRERAQVGGGFSEVFSVPGQGTTITVKFPTSLLRQEPAEPAGTEPGADTPGGHASPDTSGAGEPAADGSRGTVHV